MHQHRFSLKTLFAAVLWFALGFACIEFAQTHEFAVPPAPQYDSFREWARMAKATIAVAGILLVCAGFSSLLKRLRFVAVLILLLAGTLLGTLAGHLIESALAPGYHFSPRSYDDETAGFGPLGILCMGAGSIGVPLLAEVLLYFRPRNAESSSRGSDADD